MFSMEMFPPKTCDFWCAWGLFFAEQLCCNAVQQGFAAVQRNQVKG
jgi:hypothetical protein